MLEKKFSCVKEKNLLHSGPSDAQGIIGRAQSKICKLGGKKKEREEERKKRKTGREEEKEEKEEKEGRKVGST